MFRSDLFDYTPIPDPVQPERPSVLSVAQWREQGGPNYQGIFAWRIEQLAAIRKSVINSQTNRPVLMDGILEYYRTRPSEFIMDWCDTYDPRRKSLKWLPFVLFQRQAEFLSFLNECYTDDENGLIEKCRDMGLTWLCVGWSVWAWLFVPGVAIGWGSRKQEYVDDRGNLDSIFEKIRKTIERLPAEFVPAGFNPKFHSTEMRLINPSNGASITGEIGDSIGRGGRKTIYFKDESAHYIHPENVQAALDDNTEVQIDISSVNGVGNVFYNKREAGEDWFPGCVIPSGMTRVFVADWRDHPEKDQAWYDRRKTRAINEGLQAKFAQEVDRNYSASIAGVIIPLEWIEAAEDAHIKLQHWKDDKGNPVDFLSGAFGAALDVADSEEGDRNAGVIRKGIVLFEAEEWGERDVGSTTRRMLVKLKPYKGIVCQYDSVGMGSSVKAEFNRLTTDEKIIDPNDLLMVPWNAGAGVLNPNFTMVEDDDETPLNGDFFYNLKAQAWWALKMAFFRTWQAVVQGVRHDPNTLISLSSEMPLIRQIKKELSQPVMEEHSTTLKQIVNKKPKGTRSPNIADAIVMAYYPLDPNLGQIVVGRHGTT